MQDRLRDVGLFRYSLVREPADPKLTKAERGALVRALAAADHVGPGGCVLRVGRSTLDEWIRAWRAGGFDALVPKPRVVEPRTPAEVLALAEACKREAPGRSAAQVAEVMGEAMAAAGAGAVPPSARTIQRHFARLGLNTRPDGSPPKAYGRFEASAPNELWTGDAMHGPVVAGRKAYLLAFIDDFSRALPGHRWTASEDTVRLEAALRAGLACRGVPRAILVDRGSAFVSGPLARACAVLGTRLIHASPRAAATKGKIERFFRTVTAHYSAPAGQEAAHHPAHHQGRRLCSPAHGGTGGARGEVGQACRPCSLPGISRRPGPTRRGQLTVGIAIANSTTRAPANERRWGPA